MASLADLYPELAYLEGSRNIYRDEEGRITNLLPDGRAPSTVPELRQPAETPIWRDPVRMAGLSSDDLAYNLQRAQQAAAYERMAAGFMDPAAARAEADRVQAMDSENRSYAYNKMQQIAQVYGGSREAANAREMQAYKVADYLAQFLPPDRVLSETARLTGVKLGAETTPNLLKRKGEELGLEKTRAETESTRAQAEERRTDVATKRQKLVQEKADDFGTLETGITNLNRLADAAATIRDDPALRRAAGPIAGRYVPTLTQGAANIEANLFSLKAQVGFAALTALREASKTGGGLGNVSDNDIKNLQNSIAALELTQSPENLRKSLDTVIEYTNVVREKMERGYRAKYGKPEVELPRPAYEQLPAAARQQLQQGKATEFGNGQVWTLHNGVPKRLK